MDLNYYRDEILDDDFIKDIIPPSLNQHTKSDKMDPYVNFTLFNETKDEYEHVPNTGRVHVDITKSVAPFELFQTNTPKENYDDSTNTILSETVLSKVFFSKKNINTLQSTIILNVNALLKGRSHTIGKQSEEQLQIIMRSIFLQHSKNLDFNIQEQIKDLNNKVIEFSVKTIYSNVLQYLDYIKDISSPRKVLPEPQKTNIDGEKRGYSFMTLHGIDNNPWAFKSSNLFNKTDVQGYNEITGPLIIQDTEKELVQNHMKNKIFIFYKTDTDQLIVFSPFKLITYIEKGGKIDEKIINEDQYDHKNNIIIKTFSRYDKNGKLIEKMDTIGIKMIDKNIYSDDEGISFIGELGKTKQLLLKDYDYLKGLIPSNKYLSALSLVTYIDYDFLAKKDSSYNNPSEIRINEITKEMTLHNRTIENEKKIGDGFLSLSGTFIDPNKLNINETTYDETYKHNRDTIVDDLKKVSKELTTNKRGIIQFKKVLIGPGVKNKADVFKVAILLDENKIDSLYDLVDKNNIYVTYKKVKEELKNKNYYRIIYLTSFHLLLIPPTVGDSKLDTVHSNKGPTIMLQFDKLGFFGKNKVFTFINTTNNLKYKAELMG